MNFLITKAAPRAMAAVCTDDELRISLTDGRWLSVPIIWFPRLANASAFERASYEGIHWPSVDEDISVIGLLAGQPSVESKMAHA